MKAMVFAAGLGTRLGAIGTKTPKCLLEAGGKRVIEHVVQQLKQAGVTSIVINLHHLGDAVEKFFRDRGDIGLEVSFSREAELLGTGGGLKKVAALLSNGDFFVHNSDVYTDLDLNELLKSHRERKGLATLGVMSRESDRALLFDEGGALVGWENSDEGNRKVIGEKVSVQRLAFSGIQVVSPRIFSYMATEPGNFSIIRAYMNAVDAGEKIFAYPMDDSYWIDVGTPERLRDLQARLSG